MSNQEVRDELMTLLVAGHETTATSLAWAFERLVRAPDALRSLVAEVDAGEDDAYITATIQETLRSRPVLPNDQPRLVVKPIEVGGWHYEPGRRPGRQRLSDAPRSRPLPGPLQLPARALPRLAARHLHAGSRSAAAGGAASAPPSRCSRCGSCSPRCSRTYEVSATAGGAEVARRRNITVRPGRGSQVKIGDRAPVAAPVAA